MLLSDSVSLELVFDELRLLEGCGTLVKVRLEGPADLVEAVQMSGSKNALNPALAVELFSSALSFA